MDDILAPSATAIRKEADLLVVRGNPLADIRRMADVAALYRGGRRVGPLPEGSVLPGVIR